ncbi:MAG TPA: MIP/aquaporin family protein [Candidatus Sulfotelmatobacter sp.]|jgi:glycerol uptake facilitator-like aquaporin|nr:MIP/aquaporin family protein [Candidatus Sulfotelmatobacter sp.]
MTTSLSRRLTAEFLGTLFLLAAITGSGIMAERLSGGNVDIALLANSIATGAALLALILTFGSLSGAHFNPAVSLAQAFRNQLSWSYTFFYITSQIAGAFVGVFSAHLMFGLPGFFISRHARSGYAQIFSEGMATFGLLLVIMCCSRFRASTTPHAVAAYITGAYWFTSSTSFANPAVTLARSVSDTFVGIRPSDVPGFLLGQFAGLAIAVFLCRWLLPPEISGGSGEGR